MKIWFQYWKRRQTTGGGFSAKFRAGVCRPLFQNSTVLARPTFLKMIPLARLIFTSKCHELAFSRQNLPNFCILRTKIWKKIGFLYRNYRSLTFLWPKLPKSIPLPRLNGRELAKSIPLARLNGLKLAKSIPLAPRGGLPISKWRGGSDIFWVCKTLSSIPLGKRFGA